MRSLHVRSVIMGNFFEILALLERKFFSVNIWTEMPEHAQLLLEELKIMASLELRFYLKCLDKSSWANSVDPDQASSEEQCDQGLHCLPTL